MPEIEIEHTITIRCGKKKWQPATFNVGGNQCIRLTPSHGLTGVVAAFAGIEFTKDDMAVYPSLANAEGFVKMKELRNSAQAAELKPPTRTLFDTTNAKANKKPKRSHGQVSGLRACPELFDLTVSGGKSVCMQRPIQNTDNIVIRATDENIRACLECIANGVDKSMFLAKRGYKTSGHSGVWKNGNYMYTKTPEGRERFVPNGDDEDDAQIDNEDEPIRAADLTDAEACGEPIRADVLQDDEASDEPIRAADFADAAA